MALTRQREAVFGHFSVMSIAAALYASSKQRQVMPGAAPQECFCLSMHRSDQWHICMRASVGSFKERHAFVSPFLVYSALQIYVQGFGPRPR